jgi:hypothetical protein
MEIFKKNIISSLQQELKIKENAQKRDKDSLVFIGNLKISKEAISKKLSAVNEAILKRETEIASLQDKIKNTETGLMDIEIKEDIDKEKKKQVAKTTTKIKNLKESSEKKEIYSEKQKEIYKGERSQEKDFNYVYKHYCNVVETIPIYMLENLEKMPNNRGYIWRGCWLFGKLDEDGDTIIMNESSNKIQYIHEISKKEYKIYEKKKTGRVLLSVQNRPEKTKFRF